MAEINPQKIKKTELAVGIPSYNEVDSIARVTKQIDKGLQKYFGGKKTVIVNADANSPDNTRDAFLKTPTKSPKIYVSPPPNLSGKGRSVFTFFKKMNQLGAKAGMITDADIKSSSPEWAKCLLSPILQGYDLVTPVYRRHKHDGTITNQLCYPVVYGLLGCNIRQPIGGEFGFSEKFYKYLLEQEWYDSAFQFGIDIFMTTQAIKGGFKIGQAKLGVKSHNPSASKLTFMFEEVSDSLFKNLSENKKFWQKKIKTNNPPVVCDTGSALKTPELKVDTELLEKNFDKKILPITTDAWTKIVYEMLYSYDSGKQEVIKELAPLFFARIVTFINETAKTSPEKAEKIILDQAKYFYKNRDYLLDKYK